MIKMLKNIFRKFKNNFTNKFNVYDQIDSKPNTLEIINEKSNNEFKIFKFDGKQFDLNSLDKESKNILELYEISKMKIQFFENLLKQLKLDQNLKIIELKSKLKDQNSLN